MDRMVLTSTAYKVHICLNDLSSYFNNVVETEINKAAVSKMELVSSIAGDYIELTYINGSQDQLTYVTPTVLPIESVNGETDFTTMAELYTKLRGIF
jgi:iron-sulfur cluster repair protein YtfE (RIC family)